MVPLLYCALADTDYVEIQDDIVYVHEWGVVELDEGYLEARGAQWGYLDPCGYLVDYYPDEAVLSMAVRDEAPLVGPYPADFFED